MKNFKIEDGKRSTVTEYVAKSKNSVRASKAPRPKTESIAPKEDGPLPFSSKSKMAYSIEVSPKTILMILLIGVGIYLGYRLLVVIAMLFFAFAFASALLPSVRYLERKGIGKGLSIALVYLFGILIFAALVLLIAWPLGSQVAQIGDVFSGGLEKYLVKISDFLYPIFGGDSTPTEFLHQLESFIEKDLKSFFDLSKIDVSGAFATVSGVGKVIGYTILALVISVYILIDHDNFLDLLILQIVNEKESKLVRKLIIGIEAKLGRWLMGQVILSAIIGVLAWIMLTIMRVPYAVPLAVLAGLFEVVPGFGPTFAAIPAVLLGFITNGTPGAIGVTIGYVIIQQLENTFIVPRVMGDATGLKRIAIIIGVIVGFTLAGPIGTLLAVPILVVMQIGINFYIEFQKIRARQA
ncbi:MAG: AI-2E family transporter [Candidatus Dojkabacteria bacterium]